MKAREKSSIWIYENDEGEEIEVKLPGKYEVCHRCRGKGTHVNPNVDGHGITSDEWERDWSPEEREGYMRGDYDVSCYSCGGQRVEWVVDLDAMPVELRERYEKHLQDEAEYRRYAKMERDYGC